MTAGPLAVPGTGTTRTPLRVDVDRGRLETAGQRASFDPATPDSALIAYLKLVRKLRDVEREPSFVLRREEVVVLAGALQQDAVVVLDRLGELMGATVTQRRSMVTAFLAGALLIAVATGATALAPSDGRVAPTTPTGGERSDVVASAPAESSVTVRSGSAVAPDAPAAPDAATSIATDPTLGTAPSGVASAPAPSSPSSGTPAADAGDTGDGGDTADVTTPIVDDAPLPPQGSTPPADQQPARWRTGPEIVQPGATIDIPGDADDGQAQEPVDETPIEDIPVGTPVVPDPDLPDLPDLPPPPVDDTPVSIPVVPDPDLPDLPPPPVGSTPVGETVPPVTPPVDITPPVTPPVDITPPVTPQTPGDDAPGQGNGGQGNGGQGNAGQGNSGVGVGNGGGNGTGNEGGGVGPGGDAGQGNGNGGQGNGNGGQGNGNAGEGNRGVGVGNGGGNGTGNEGGGVGPR